MKAEIFGAWTKRFGMTGFIVAILVGWGHVPEARAAEFTVTRADDPVVDGCKPG